MKNLLIIILSVLYINVFAEGEGVVNITSIDDNGEYNLSGNIFYLVDTANIYTFDKVLSEEFQTKFIQSKENVFHYNRNAPSVWYKIKIHNSTGEIKHLVLSINNPIISDITFFNSFDSVFYHTGFFYSFYQRQILYKNYLFKVTVPPGQQGDVCFKISSQLQPVYMPVYLMTEDLSIKKLRINSFISGLFYSVVVVFLILIFTLWRIEKDKLFIFFLSLLIFFVFIHAWRNSIMFQYIWPSNPNLNYTVGRILYGFLIFFLLLFEYNLLNFKKISKKLTIISIVILLVSFFFGISQLFIKPFEYFYFGIRILLIILGILTIWGWVKSRKTDAYVNLYTFAFSLIILVQLFRVFFTVETYGIGFYDTQPSTITTIFFFFIIIYVFVIKFKKLHVELVSMQKNLEHLVDERTSQINSQKEELKSQHEELIQQKEILQTQREELRAQKELLEIKNTDLLKLSLVASKTDNLIYIFLPDGELDWFNEAFSNFLKMSFEEYKQNNKPLNITDISSNNNIRHVLNTCLREKSVVTYESKMTDTNNVERWYHTTLSPILDKHENIKYLIAIDTDITRLKQYEEELEKQKRDAEQQKNLAVKRKEELEERQIEITDSIRYAKRIQTGIIPKVKQIQRYFYDSFVLFIPKDIVSGDFYWYHQIGDKYFIAAVDCTGHGVPGAFMSIIGTYLLNSIIIYNEVTDAAEILKQLNRKIKIALKSDPTSQSSDGMDIAIAIIDKKEKQVEFASALRPIFLFNNNKFIEIKGDKIPITSSIAGTNINAFTKHIYPFNEGDTFYLFSDGLTDQFGGEHEKKFLTKRLKKLLFEINALSMKKQKEIIKKTYDEWRGDNEQVDDILIIGIRNKERPDLYSSL